MVAPAGRRLGQHRVPGVGGVGLATLHFQLETLLGKRLDGGHDVLAREVGYAHLFLAEEERHYAKALSTPTPARTKNMPRPLRNRIMV